MTTFDKREEGFEKKFAMDEELQFKADARRNKLLGLWAAEKLGLSGDEAEAYAKSVVMADFEEAGDEDVFRKISADFDAKSVDQSDHQIRRTMDELMATAVQQIKAVSGRCPFRPSGAARLWRAVSVFLDVHSVCRPCRAGGAAAARWRLPRHAAWHDRLLRRGADDRRHQCRGRPAMVRALWNDAGDAGPGASTPAPAA